MTNNEIINLIKRQGKEEFLEEIKKLVKPLAERSKSNEELKDHEKQYLKWGNIIIGEITNLLN